MAIILATQLRRLFLKKAFIIIAMLAMVIAPVAAYEITGIGVSFGVDAVNSVNAKAILNFSINGKNEINIQAGYGLGKTVEILAGYDYKAASFMIEDELLYIKIGANAGGFFPSNNIEFPYFGIIAEASCTFGTDLGKGETVLSIFGRITAGEAFFIMLEELPEPPWEPPYFDMKMFQFDASLGFALKFN